MKQRGRKSAAELSVVRPLATELQPAPEHFNDEQAELWCAIVASKDQDWFDAGTWPLLEAYVRTVHEYRKVSDLIDNCHPISDSMAFAQYEEIHKVQDRLASQLARLATKMRLSQQSKYGARGADGAAGRGGSGPGKPWQ